MCQKKTVEVEIAHFDMQIYNRKFEKPLVIGKACKPRCFINVQLSNLPIVWCCNRKALMDSQIMKE